MRPEPLVLWLSLCLIGCSGSADDSGDDANDEGAAGAAGASAADGAGMAPVLGAEGADDEATLIEETEGEVSAEPAECARETYEGERTPVNLYLLLDISGSMLAPVEVTFPYTLETQRQWDAVRSAVVHFIEAPESEGLNLALNYYPELGERSECSGTGQCAETACITSVCDIGLVAFGEAFPCTSNADCTYVLEQNGDLYLESCVQPGRCSDAPLELCLDHSQCEGECVAMGRGICPGTAVCDATSYEVPAVNLGQLPADGATMVDSLGSSEPDPFGVTPTHVALQGAYTRVQEWIDADPETPAFVVLATDGQPIGCTAGDTREAQLAAATAETEDVIDDARTGGIDTFVIGVVPDITAVPAEFQAEATAIVDELQGALDRMAELGGTDAAFTVSVNVNATDAFASALSTIRGAVLPCEYTIPEPSAGAVDFNRLNVELSGTTIPKVDDVDACLPDDDAWYYNVDDETQTPTRVVLCPNTCERAGSGGATRIDVVLGCQTVVARAR